MKNQRQEDPETWEVNFWPAPKWILDRWDITAEHKLILIAIYGQTDPRGIQPYYLQVDYLAKRLGMSVAKIIDLVEELAHWGIIVKGSFEYQTTVKISEAA